MKASRERLSRIEPGIPTSTGRSALDEALKVVRGQDPEMGRQKMSEVASSTATSIDYRVVNPVKIEPPKVRAVEADPGATWAAMLQTAELKATLEGKMELLSQQIKSLQSPKPNEPPLQGKESLYSIGFISFLRDEIENLGFI